MVNRIVRVVIALVSLISIGVYAGPLMFLLTFFSMGLYLLTHSNKSDVPINGIPTYHLNINPSKSQSQFSKLVANESNTSPVGDISSQLEKQLSKQASLIHDLELKLLQKGDSTEKLKQMQTKIDVLGDSIGSLENRKPGRLDGPTIVQNITYNINDSALSGNLNNNLQIDSNEEEFP